MSELYNGKYQFLTHWVQRANVAVSGDKDEPKVFAKMSGGNKPDNKHYERSFQERARFLDRRGRLALADGNTSLKSAAIFTISTTASATLITERATRPWKRLQPAAWQLAHEHLSPPA